MNIKKIISLLSLTLLAIMLTSCGPNSKLGKKYNKPFKHNQPLIKNDIQTTGKAEITKTLEMGPKPVVGDAKKLKKRRKITSERQRNYLLISDDYPLLKQRVTLKFKNLDFKETMKLLGRIGEINVLVGDEVAGAISAELIDVPWDKAFQALLDMKNFASDIDVTSNLIRVHSPENLTAQETYKSERAQAVKNKVELEDSVEPIISEIFRLYYISPELAKATIEELFQTGGDAGTSPIKITEETATRSIIVRGKEKDLDTVDKVLAEIDIKTEQVLIEAFVVKATSEFERQLGTRLGGFYKRNDEQIGGVIGTASTKSAIDDDTAALTQTAKDMITNLPAIGATSGIGVLKRTGSAVLKAEITALEKTGIVETISNPKVFTINNQPASVTQGKEIPYETSDGEGTTTSFKEAALKLQVTPSIIGDGNVLLDIQVNNDDADTSQAEPPITKMEITTKLLVADGDIVVIGGIKSNNVVNSKEQVPGLGNVPVIGNLLKYKKKEDKLEELLIFIAPRIL